MWVTAMWAMVALLLSVVVMLVCSKPNVNPICGVLPRLSSQTPCRNLLSLATRWRVAETSVPLISEREDEDSMFHSREVLVRAGPLDGANPFGASLNGDFKPVDTSSSSELFVGRSFSLSEYRR